MKKAAKSGGRNIIPIMFPAKQVCSAAQSAAIIWTVKSQEVAKIIFELGM